MFKKAEDTGAEPNESTILLTVKPGTHLRNLKLLLYITDINEEKNVFVCSFLSFNISVQKNKAFCE